MPAILSQMPSSCSILMQISVGTSWTNAVGNGEGHSVAPTLEAIPLRSGGAAVAVLAGGAHTAAVISEHGRLLDSLELPVKMTHGCLLNTQLPREEGIAWLGQSR